MAVSVLCLFFTVLWVDGGLATEFGLGPGANEIEKNTRVISEIGKSNCDVI